MGITLEEIKKDEEILAIIDRSDRNLKALGYTEHGLRHSKVTAKTSRLILESLGVEPRKVELSEIAAYLHDIGNLINREMHSQTGAAMLFTLLKEKGMPVNEVSDICAAVGNHHEEDGEPVSRIAAAVIISDKADVHRSRVRNPKHIKFDIHDRVNYAVSSSKILILNNKKEIKLDIEVDTKISSVMEYFEIFLSRMIVSQRAARYLEAEFQLVINNVRML